MTQGGINSLLETKKQTQRNPGQKHLLIGVTDPRCEGADFSGNLALKSALHVQSTALNDVNCSCECSALLQIKPHDFKNIINGHLGKVESIGLAQHHTEILWLHQRQNPVFYNGVRLGKKIARILPEIVCFSHQHSLFFQEPLKLEYHRVCL